MIDADNEAALYVKVEINRHVQIKYKESMQ
jgi:hypothetical protein